MCHCGKILIYFDELKEGLCFACQQTRNCWSNVTNNTLQSQQRQLERCFTLEIPDKVSSIRLDELILFRKGLY